VLEDGHEGVDAAVAEVRRHKEQHALRGEVRRHEVGGRAGGSRGRRTEREPVRKLNHTMLRIG
jgi:hypothetical protein